MRQARDVFTAVFRYSLSSYLATYGFNHVIPLHDDNPTVITPLVTVSLIVICTATFLWEFSLGEQTQKAIYQFGAIPSAILGDRGLAPELVLIPAWLTVLTSMFMHGGWMHLIGNMLYLWIFGNNIEDAMGHVRFIIFYLLCGLAAFAAHAIPAAESTIPMVGASGAISGVLGAYLLLYPHAKVLVLIPLGFFITTLRIPAAFVLLFWFVLQIYSSVNTEPAGAGIAWGAHIGGFIAGMALLPLFKRAQFSIPHKA